jgi:hypothetical protein
MTALTWSHAVTEIPESGLDVGREADPAERGRLAAELGILDCTALRADYEIRRQGEGRYLMSGAVTARISQACVVSLEPVEQRIDERILVELVAGAEHAGGAGGADLAVLDGEREIEPLAGGRIDAGRIVFETVAAAIDPYPRKEGAVFEWTDPKEAQPGGPAGPFAGLSKLKK